MHCFIRAHVIRPLRVSQSSHCSGLKRPSQIRSAFWTRIFLHIHSKIPLSFSPKLCSGMCLQLWHHSLNLWECELSLTPRLKVAGQTHTLQFHVLRLGSYPEKHSYELAPERSSVTNTEEITFPVRTTTNIWNVSWVIFSLSGFKKKVNACLMSCLIWDFSPNHDKWCATGHFEVSWFVASPTTKSLIINQKHSLPKNENSVNLLTHVIPNLYAILYSAIFSEDQ